MVQIFPDLSAVYFIRSLTILEEYLFFQADKNRSKRTQLQTWKKNVLSNGLIDIINSFLSYSLANHWALHFSCQFPWWQKLIHCFLNSYIHKDTLNSVLPQSSSSLPLPCPSKLSGLSAIPLYLASLISFQYCYIFYFVWYFPPWNLV